MCICDLKIDLYLDAESVLCLCKKSDLCLNADTTDLSHKQNNFLKFFKMQMGSI